MMRMETTMAHEEEHSASAGRALQYLPFQWSPCVRACACLPSGCFVVTVGARGAYFMNVPNAFRALLASVGVCVHARST